MEDVKFQDLAAVLATPSHVAVGTKLRVADKPEPFVPPVFTIDDRAALSASEVILIRASAAVGKTTLARALSANREIPILDLAKVPVATGSLVGILNDFKGELPAVESFHRGLLPLLVDALDEGRLNSGDNGLLSFIETSADLILQDRSNRCAKLVMLGRPEAIAYAELWLTDKGVACTTLDVGFFDEDGAHELVHAYAKAEAEPSSLYLVHRKPAEVLVSTYFTKIAAALGLSPDELWTQPQGRSFAGYAPVLAAIGSLLPRIENYVEAQNRLDEVGTSSAWGVIESVLESIVLREQGKVCDQLAQAGLETSGGGLYTPEEQAALLMQLVQRLPLAGTGHVRLSPPDMARYADQVQRFLPEHPFLKEGKFSNDVIASYVLALAITKGWKIRDDALVRQLARQPFLWRFLKETFNEDTILEGEYLGYILSSFWSDPLTVDESVVVHDLAGGGGSFVEISLRGESTKFTATTPLHFYGQMRNVFISTSEPMSLIGIGDGATRVFSLSGENRIVGSIIDLHATELRLRTGSTWLDADVVPASGQFNLVIQDRVDYGWSKRLASTYPFSNFVGNLLPETAENDDHLTQLLSDCAARAPAGTAITLFADYSVADNDYLRSVYMRHGDRFRTLISCLVEAGHAETMPIQASGAPKIRVRLKTAFVTLRDAARSTEGGELAGLIADIRQKL